MKLLLELNENIEVVQEDTGNVYLQGIFMQSEVLNGNGRKYPEAVLANEVDRYNNQFVVTGRALGELKHPNASPTIDLDRASHRIVMLEKRGPDFYGKALILDTPCGNIVKGFIKGGVSLGVSSRGLGSVVRKDSVDIVQDDFKLITPADIVYNPSAPNAMVTAIMEESDWLFEGGKWVPQYIETAQEIIKKSPNQVLKEGNMARKLMKDYFEAMRNSL